MSDYEQRFSIRRDELEWLYMELYDDRGKLGELETAMEVASGRRSGELRELDAKREEDPKWFLRGKMVGMAMRPDLFAENLRGVIGKLDYFSEQGITYLYLARLLKTPQPEGDGAQAIGSGAQADGNSSQASGSSAYADGVGDVDPAMGSNYDLAALTSAMRKRGMSLCVDFAVDLTSFNDMVSAILKLANLGVEVFQIDLAQISQNAPRDAYGNQPMTHSIVRMLRLILESVCPSVLLKGEAEMPPREQAAYFGTQKKPECHFLDNVSATCTQWSALATGDARQLKHQLDEIHSLPGHCHFVNSVRGLGDIGWNLDEDFGKCIGQDPMLHRKYLFEFYEGAFPGSWACGKRRQFSPMQGASRTCGTTASLCGIERGILEHDAEQVDMGIRRLLLMYAVAMAMDGFPMVASGDEIGQLNGWEYNEDPRLREDLRNLHQTPFNWDNAKKRVSQGTVQQRIWDGLRKLWKVRNENPCFAPNAWVTTWDTHNNHVLAILRRKDEKTLVWLFNFTGKEQTADLNLVEEKYLDEISGDDIRPQHCTLAPYQYVACKSV